MSSAPEYDIFLPTVGITPGKMSTLRKFGLANVLTNIMYNGTIVTPLESARAPLQTAQGQEGQNLDYR